MLKFLFPIKLHLTILQLEGYNTFRFLRWVVKNLFVRQVETKKKLVFTSKIQKIIILSILTTILITFLFYTLFNFVGALSIFLILNTQPYIVLTIVVLLIKPYEIINRYLTIEETRKKVLSLKNLEVIGITGSFGKSSTKEILYQIISPYFPTLRTPESFNTVFGVAKVVNLELDENYRYFICEMAAYNKGEIKTLCHMVPPKYGILTGITTQHFERFGSLENTIEAKFELVESVKNLHNFTYNLDDVNISDELQKRNIKPNPNSKIVNPTFTRDGSEFDLEIKNKKYHISTKLFGFANIKNILFASDMALKLGLSPLQIVNQIKNLKPIDSRLVLIKDRQATIVNNTFSSNPKGFRETLETAKKISGKKVLVTPGLVELGKIEEEIHLALGKETRGIFNNVILVGENSRTEAFAKGLGGNYEFINDTRERYFKIIEELKEKYEWIFLENDVTQNY